MIFPDPIIEGFFREFDRRVRERPELTHLAPLRQSLCDEALRDPDRFVRIVVSHVLIAAEEAQAASLGAREPSFTFDLDDLPREETR